MTDFIKSLSSARLQISRNADLRSGGMKHTATEVFSRAEADAPANRRTLFTMEIPRPDFA